MVEDEVRTYTSKIGWRRWRLFTVNQNSGAASFDGIAADNVVGT